VRTQSSKENKHLRNSNLSNEHKVLDRGLKLTVLFTLLLAIYTILFGENNIFKYFDKVKIRNELLSQVESLKSENKKLQRTIDYLQNDPFYIEKKARENLGLIKEDEEVYVLVNYKKPQTKDEEFEPSNQTKWIDKIKEKYQEFKIQ
jgi:cell division protein FtsB